MRLRFFSFQKVWSGTAGILMLASALSGAVSANEVIERIVAVVNDEIVTEQDLQFVMAPVVAQLRTRYAGAEFDERYAQLRQEFLNKVIEDKLILSEARRRKIVVKDNEVDDTMADVRNKFPSREVFIKSLEEQGMTEKKLWNRFQEQILTQKLVGYEVRSKVSVSPGEVNDYYKNHPEEFLQGDRVKLEHILVRVGTRTDEEARSLAESIVKQLGEGKSFEDLARAYSEGSEAKEGGQMGWVERGQLMGEIDEKIFTLEDGQITSPPLRSTLGYHIFKVLEREKAAARSFADVKDQIQDKLFKHKLKERLDSWIANLKKTAYISIR